MKIRKTYSSGENKVELQMTPMIDIVFQLLTFFIMTFKIATTEGDFNIKMPLAAASSGLPDVNQVPPMKLKLVADQSGKLASITLNDQPFRDFKQLQLHIISVLGNERGPGSIQSTAEVEFDLDYGLHYEHVIGAISAVTGYVGSQGDIIKLVEKVTFAPPRDAAGGNP